jgi:hypothetical protein
MIEEMLIDPIIAIMTIYRLTGDSLLNRGFVANFNQDIQSLCTVLSIFSIDLSIFLKKKIKIRKDILIVIETKLKAY